MIVVVLALVWLPAWRCSWTGSAGGRAGRALEAVTGSALTVLGPVLLSEPLPR